MRCKVNDAALKNMERGKYGNKSTFFPLVKKQFKIKEDDMFYTRKLGYLILVIFLFSFCFPSFAQVEGDKVEGKKSVAPVNFNVCPGCPKITPPNPLIQIDFTGLTTSTYTIPGPYAPLPIPGTPPYGRYAITNDPSLLNSQWLNTNQLPSSHGNILVCDGFERHETKLFGKTVSNPVPGRRYIFCAWFRNINTIGGINPKVRLKIVPNSSTPVQSMEKTLLQGAPWGLLYLVWVCPAGVTQVTPEIWLTSVGAIGNDVGVDDISFIECKPACDCDKWDPVTVTWTAPAPLGNQTNTVSCGGYIPISSLCRNNPIKLTFKYNCKPPDCNSSYTWTVKGPTGIPIATGISATTPCDVVFNPTPGLHDYTVSVRPICGNNKCEPCEIRIQIKEIVDCCECAGCNPVIIKWMAPTGVSNATIACGKDLNVGDVCLCQKINLIFYCKCNSDYCHLTYTWQITGPNGYQLSGSSQAPCNIPFIPTEPGVYSITVTPKCGNTVCPPCQVNVTVKGIVLCGTHTNDEQSDTPLPENR